MTKSIAVIGAGPKGVALAAKAFAINTALGRQAIDVTLYDPAGVGSAWRGDAGFTNGFQRLCTPAERDLGFPYRTKLFGLDWHQREGIDRPVLTQDSGLSKADQVNRLLLERASWQSYLISEGIYGNWVSAGRRMPSHAEFAGYLAWAAKSVSARLIEEKVTAVRPDTPAAGWVLKTETSETPYDGVVVTGGHADPDTTIGGSDENIKARCPSASTYWSQSDAIVDILRDAVKTEGVAHVGFIGSGAASATVAADLIRREPQILGTPDSAMQLTFFTRGGGSMQVRHPNLYDDRLFHDADLWKAFPDRARFVEQSVNGAVWSTLLDQFSHFQNLTFEPCSVKGAKPHATGRGGFQVAVEVEPEGPDGIVQEPVDHIVDVLVDARAPDARWFLRNSAIGPSFLPLDVGEKLRAVPPSAFGEDLAYPSFSGLMGAGFHAPMLAAEITPGASTLMALGMMSDRILEPYL